MNLNNTREAITAAFSCGWTQSEEHGFAEYLLYLTEIEKSIVNNSGSQIVETLEAAHIMAAVNLQREPIRHWLRYTYGFPTDIKTVPIEKKVIMMYLYNKHFYNQKWPDRHIMMCALAIEDYCQRVRKSERFPASTYCKEMMVWQANWKRDGWDDKLDLILSDISRFDSEGLGIVSMVVKALRGEAEIDGVPVGPSRIIEEMISKKGGFCYNRGIDKKKNSPSTGSPPPGHHTQTVKVTDQTK